MEHGLKCTAGTLECDGEGQKSNFILNGLAISLESAPIAIFCLVTETKGQTFRGISGFYSTSGYTAVTFPPILSP